MAESRFELRQHVVPIMSVYSSEVIPARYTCADKFIILSDTTSCVLMKRPLCVQSLRVTIPHCVNSVNH